MTRGPAARGFGGGTGFGLNREAVPSVHVQAAVDVQRLAGDVACVFADQEVDGGSNVPRAAHPVHHQVLDELIFAFLAEGAAHDVGVDGTGRDGIDGDVVLPQLAGGGRGQADDVGLGHVVRGL